MYAHVCTHILSEVAKYGWRVVGRGRGAQKDASVIPL